MALLGICLQNSFLINWNWAAKTHSLVCATIIFLIPTASVQYATSYVAAEANQTNSEETWVVNLPVNNGSSEVLACTLYNVSEFTWTTDEEELRNVKKSMGVVVIPEVVKPSVFKCESDSKAFIFNLSINRKFFSQECLKLLLESLCKLNVGQWPCLARGTGGHNLFLQRSRQCTKCTGPISMVGVPTDSVLQRVEATGISRP